MKTIELTDYVSAEAALRSSELKQAFVQRRRCVDARCFGDTAWGRASLTTTLGDARIPAGFFLSITSTRYCLRFLLRLWRKQTLRLL